MDNVKMKHQNEVKVTRQKLFFGGVCKQSCTSENMFLLTKCFLFFLLSRSNTYRRESSVGRLLSLNSWCGIKSYTISFLSLTQEASQGKTSYVHQHLFAFDEAMQCMYVCKNSLRPMFQVLHEPLIDEDPVFIATCTERELRKRKKRKFSLWVRQCTSTGFICQVSAHNTRCVCM